MKNHSDFQPHPINLVTMAANIVFSLPSNSYIVCLIASGPKGKLLREFFQLNLSIFEVFYSTICICYFSKFFISTFLPNGLFNSLIWAGRPLLQCCICLEHFVAVVYPVSYLRYRTLQVKAAVAVAAWTIIFLFIVFYVLFNKFKDWVLAVGCIAFMSVMLFCYVCVFAALKKPRPGEGRGERDRSVKTRAIYFITTILVSFSLGYVMWITTIVLNKKFTWFVHKRPIRKTCNLIISMCGLVQPVMYLQRRQKCFCRRSHRKAN